MQHEIDVAYLPIVYQKAQYLEYPVASCKKRTLRDFREKNIVYVTLPVIHVYVVRNHQVIFTQNRLQIIVETKKMRTSYRTLVAVLIMCESNV